MRSHAPAPPEHLDDQAKAEWVRILPELLDRGVQLSTDGGLIEGYVVSYSRWRQAEADLVKTGGPVVRSPQGGAQQNPHLGVARAAQRDMRHCLEALEKSVIRRAKAMPGLVLSGRKRPFVA